MATLLLFGLLVMTYLGKQAFFKIYTTGYEMGTSCAEFCQYSATFQRPEKTQEPANTVTAYKPLKILKGFL